MLRSIAEINEKIRKGEVVVATAEEMHRLVREKGVSAAAREVDVVTTGTFGPMCSSGMYLNVGHTRPRIKIGGGRCELNGVPAYTGFAAADIMLGCTALPDDDPRNKVHPGRFSYGGGHVIEEFVSGRDILLTASAYGTDCYPRKKLESRINIKDVNEAVLFNPRNAYQNYNCAVNGSSKTIYTYMGMLKHDLGNATFCSAGVFSPLMKDPLLRTIGIGTRIFLGGGDGFVAWWGTQHNPSVSRKENGTPVSGGATLALIGDLKKMSGRWLLGTSMRGYGVTLTVGVGIPIPVLDEELAASTGLGEDGMFTQIVDYGLDYPENVSRSLGEVSYADLRSGSITVRGKTVPVSSLSSLLRAREIAGLLKTRILEKKFFLTEKVEDMPSAGSGYAVKPFSERPVASGPA